MKFLKKLFGKKKRTKKWTGHMVKIYRNPPETYRDENGALRWRGSNERVKSYNALPMAKGDE